MIRYEDLGLDAIESRAGQGAAFYAAGSATGKPFSGLFKDIPNLIAEIRQSRAVIDLARRALESILPMAEANGLTESDKSGYIIVRALAATRLEPDPSDDPQELEEEKAAFGGKTPTKG